MYQPCSLASSTVLVIMPTARSAAGVTITFAPRNRISFRRSTLNGSAIVTTSGYPLAAQTIARPIPVFPLVASITVWPGLRSPDLSAASITPRANRSFTEPRGLKGFNLDEKIDAPRRQTIDSHDRRITDCFNNTLVFPPHAASPDLALLLPVFCPGQSKAMLAIVPPDRASDGRSNLAVR